MTNEQAIAHGMEQLEIFGGEHREFIKLAIKALEQEPCEDAISREAVDDILCLYSDRNGMIDAREAVRMVQELPPVKQEPKYCDRNICLKNEYSGIGCDKCEVTKTE